MDSENPKHEFAGCGHFRQDLRIALGFVLMVVLIALACFWILVRTV